MAEYIERKAFIEAVKDIPMWGSVAAMFADGIPAADVVPVVRCKGCKYAYINSFAVSSGEALCTLSGKPMQQDDFCSYGEPKEGNHA